MISSRMISFQKVMVKSRQVLHPFLPDTVALETEEQMLEREQSECHGDMGRGRLGVG